jgi:hypothetical protein
MPDNRNLPIVTGHCEEAFFADEAISVVPRRLLRALRALAMTASFWVGAKRRRISLLKAKNETLRFAQGDKLDLLRISEIRAIRG